MWRKWRYIKMKYEKVMVSAYVEFVEFINIVFIIVKNLIYLAKMFQHLSGVLMELILWNIGFSAWRKFFRYCLTILKKAVCFCRKNSTMVKDHTSVFHVFSCLHLHNLYGSTCHIDDTELTNHHFLLQVYILCMGIL